MDIAIVTQTKLARNEAIAIFQSVPVEQVNRIPYVGSWTMGQAAEHVLKATRFILQALRGEQGPANRDPKAMVPKIEAVFLDFKNKLKSPEVIEPTGGEKDKMMLLEALQTETAALETIAANENLDSLCSSQELPAFGLITRYEWISFFICHTKRHIVQLEKIRVALNTKWAVNG